MPHLPCPRRPREPRHTVGLLPAALAATFALALPAQVTDPAITAWRVNHAAAFGSSPDPAIHAVVSQISADVTTVRYTATDAYVEANGIPSYPLGPFAGNPNPVSSQNWRFRIPLVPTRNTGTLTPTGLGPIGVFVNGVVLFNAKDARSYLNQGVWNQNAVYVEAGGFDSTFGHPAPGGVYHHHQRPPSLLAQLCDDGRHHSPIIGFAFDGFPIYGPYGFANRNGTGGVRRISSSYRLRNLTTRAGGPPVGAQYPLGYYIEDHEYVAGLGDLDACNCRFAVTPEYPAGTWAYYATIDAAGSNAYPYLVGPQYFGVLVTANTNRSVVIPGTAVSFAGSGLACPQGTGCPSVQPLQLAFAGLPDLGATLHIDISNGPANTTGIVILGVQGSTPYPIELGFLQMTGCRLYQSMDVATPIAFSGGSARLSLGIPASPSLWGGVFFTQGAALDANANAAGISTSNGGRIEIRG